MPCEIMLCDHWPSHGCTHNEGCCSWWHRGNIQNTWGGGFRYRGGNDVNHSATTFKLKGCENTNIVAYNHGGYGGHSDALHTTSASVPDALPRNDYYAAFKMTEIPTSKPNEIRIDTNGSCEGAVSTWKVAQGSKKNRCFWGDGDDVSVRKLFAVKDQSNDNANAFNTLKENLCKLSKNIFKNPGGGPCLEYDTAKELAKDYCSVGNRMATDASCTPTNLGNFYPQVATNYCKTAAGKADDWCSCYNVTNNVCDTDSGAAGCAQKRQTYDKLVEATPQDYKNSWSGMAACFGGVCQGVKYVPVNSNQNCSRPVQVCVQNFDIQGIADSTIDARCDQTANTGTPSSAGDTPSGTPSGTPTPSLLDTTLDLNNNTTRLVVGGVGGLFVMCCCLLVIILMSSGGRGGGSSRFRR